MLDDTRRGIRTEIGNQLIRRNGSAAGGAENNVSLSLPPARSALILRRKSVLTRCSKDHLLYFWAATPRKGDTRQACASDAASLLWASQLNDLHHKPRGNAQLQLLLRQAEDAPELEGSQEQPCQNGMGRAGLSNRVEGLFRAPWLRKLGISLLHLRR